MGISKKFLWKNKDDNNALCMYVEAVFFLPVTFFFAPDILVSKFVIGYRVCHGYVFWKMSRVYQFCNGHNFRNRSRGSQKCHVLLFKNLEEVVSQINNPQKKIGAPQAREIFWVKITLVQAQLDQISSSIRCT